MAEEEKQDRDDFWNGRLTRSGYIGRSVLGLVLASALSVLMNGLSGSGSVDGPLLPFVFLMSIGLVIWQCSVTCRRINDIRASRWLIVLQFVPFLNLGLFVWLACARGWEGRMAERMAEMEWIQEKMNRK